MESTRKYWSVEMYPSAEYSRLNKVHQGYYRIHAYNAFRFRSQAFECGWTLKRRAFKRTLLLKYLRCKPYKLTAYDLRLFESPECAALCFGRNAFISHCLQSSCTSNNTIFLFVFVLLAVIELIFIAVFTEKILQKYRSSISIGEFPDTHFAFAEVDN